MLRPAQLYETELQKAVLDSWYKSENIYWNGGSGDGYIDLPKSNYDSHCFVSVDKDENVIGYISYAVDWSAMSASRLGAISFKKGSLVFAQDLYQAIRDIFYKYSMNRIQWCCCADNPAIRGYRNFIKRFGGRECGYYRQAAKLQDGKLHDSVQFEIMASEFNSPELQKGGAGEMANQEAIDKLAKYEDLEEQGLLLYLPCKIGDTVYVVPSAVDYKLNLFNKLGENNRVYEQTVNRIEVFAQGYGLITCDGADLLLPELYGETWFLTHRRAELKLKELEKNSNAQKIITI